MATYTFDKIDYGGNTYVVQDSGALQLTGGTVTGPVTFGDSITVDEATLGDLVVNGNASFTNNIQANRINGITVGSSPKFTDTVTTVTTSGSGNAITAISASNGAITATKGTTFLTSHNTYTISTTGSGNAVTAVSLSGTTFTVTKGTTFLTSLPSHNHSQIITVGDQRSTATTPNSYSNALIFQGLKNKTTIGSPSNDTYSYLVGLRGWSDSSGGSSHEIAFNDTGVFVRRGATTTWGNWERLYTTGNKPTASDVGLGNVENKSSATIRGELTSSNVTTALGYTPYNSTNPSGYTTNTGTVTKVIAGTGLSIGTTAGGNFTTSGTINHTNSVTAQTTQAVYPIKIDAQGHISAYGSAVTIPDVSAYNKNKYSAGTGLAFAATDLPSGGLDITINHSNSVTAQTTQAVYPIKIDAQGHISAYGSAATILTIGTGASNAAAGNHTHTLSLALSNDTSTVALTSGTKYQLTAGGNSIIFTTPTDYKVENDPVTAATTFYPVGSTSDSTQTEMLVKHASIKFYTAANSGTDGSARLALGNATASSSAGGKKGVIRLYGTGSQYVDITPGNITTSRTITIPDATGTMALTKDLNNYVPTSDVSTTGGASKIIKSDSEGNITITGHLSTSGGVVGEIKKDEPSAVSTTSGRYYKIAEVKLDPGVWVYTTTAEFAANTSGYRRAYSTTDSFSNGTSTAPTVIAKSLATNVAQAGGQITHTHDAMIFTVTSATTYRLVSYQNSGSTFSVTGRIYAVRIA